MDEIGVESERWITLGEGTEWGNRTENFPLSSYETGIEVTDDELDAVKIKREKFHGKWNYTIEPQS
jgi:hypothetical protein